MDISSTQSGRDQTHKSELDKFKLFYEFAVSNKEMRGRIKRQNRSSNN